MKEPSAPVKLGEFTTNAESTFNGSLKGSRVYVAEDRKLTVRRIVAVE